MHNFFTRTNKFGAPRLILSITLLFIGVSFIWPPSARPSTSPILTNEQVVDISQAAIPAGNITPPVSIDPSSLPVRVVIPKVGIDVPVSASQIVAGYWQVSSSTASYGMGSGLIGQKGNAVIFAHDRLDQFLPLKSATIGTRIYVYTSKSWHVYVIKTKKKVAATDISVVAPTTSEMLTLYTCDGINDSERLIVQAAAAGI